MSEEWLRERDELDGYRGGVMGIALSTRLRNVLEHAVRGAPQAMKDELQRLLAAPDEVARMRTALEAAETQALAEMDRVYGEAVDYNMLARSLERLRADNTRLRAELNAALDALRAAPKPPWNFRPTIGWQGVYCDWYEAQAAIGEGGGNDV